MRTVQGVTGAGAGTDVPHGTDGGAPMMAAMLAGVGGVPDGRGRRQGVA